MAKPTKPSQGFWDAVSQSETPPSRETSLRLRLPSWPGRATPTAGSPIDARVVELTETSARLITPQPLAPGSSLSLEVTEPGADDTFHALGQVTQVVPPPPVASTWIVVVTFAELRREERLRLGRWSLKLKRASRTPPGQTA